MKKHRIEELLSILVDSKASDSSKLVDNNNSVRSGSLVLDSYPLSKVIVEALIET